MKKVINISIILIIVLLLPSYVLAYSNVSYSFGQTENNGTENDTILAEPAIWAKSSYAAAGYNSYSSIDPSTTMVRSVLATNPSILFISGHGSSNSINVGNRVFLLKGYNDVNYEQRIGVKSYNWDNTTLVTLLGCYTGDGGNESISYAIWEKNRNATVLGWQYAMFVESGLPWSKRYNQKLAAGYTVEEAINYANSFTYNGDGNIRHVITYGPLTRTITLNTSSNTLNSQNLISYDDEIKIPESVNIEDEIFFNEEEDIENIINILKNKFEYFNFNNFEVQISGSGSLDMTIVQITEKIGDYSTLSGFTIFIKDGKVINIYDNTINLSQLNEDDFQKPDNYNELLQQNKNAASRSTLIKHTNSYNSDQKEKLIYDIKTGKKGLKIYTTNVKNGAVAILDNFYEIK